MASNSTYGNNGVFTFKRYETAFHIVASDGLGWEHVSVHCVEKKRSRTPTWEEMCIVKDLFWGEEDTVVQYHPSKANYVNRHPHVLHLWRCVIAGQEIFPKPSKEMV